MQDPSQTAGSYSPAEGFVSIRCHILVLLLLTTAVAPIPVAYAQQPDAAFRVTVRDGFSEEPIDGVLVQLRRGDLVRAEATSDAAGEVTFPLPLASTGLDFQPHEFRLGTPFPNPARGRVNLPITVGRSGLITATVLDALGRKLISLDHWTGAGNLILQADLPQFARGAYFIIVRHNEQTIGTAAVFLAESALGAAGIRVLSQVTEQLPASAFDRVAVFDEHKLHLKKDGYLEQDRSVRLPDELSLDAWLHVEPTRVALNGLAAFETNHLAIPLIVAYMDGTVAIALSDSTRPAQPVGAILTTPDTTRIATVTLDESGRPKRAFVDGSVVLFANYRDTLVDLGLVSGDRAPFVVRDVSIAGLLPRPLFSTAIDTREWLRSLAGGLHLASCAAHRAAESVGLQMPTMDETCRSPALEEAARIAEQSDISSIRASGAALAPYGGVLGCINGRVVEDCLSAAAGIVATQSQASDAVEMTNATHIASLLHELSTRPASISQIIGSEGDGLGNLLRAPWSVATGDSGNVYVAGWVSDNAFKITRGGSITRIIGPDGDRAGHVLDQPTWITTDTEGNVYVAGERSDNVFRIGDDGVIEEIIGPSGDRAGNALDGAFGVAVDRLGNVYVTGRYSDNVFRIMRDGSISVIMDRSGDGAGHELDDPWGVVVDASGNVFVSGWRSHNAFKVTPAGTVTQIIDQTGDGSGNALFGPRGIVVAASGSVYVVGSASNNAFVISTTGTITQIIDQNGDMSGNMLHNPTGIALDDSHNVFIAGWLTRNAFKITPGGQISEVIDPTGDQNGNILNSPTGVATDHSGNVFVVGEFSNNVFRIAAQQ